jgi:hypothetical protein
MKFLWTVCLLLAAHSAFALPHSPGAGGLQITYGPHGIERLVYGGAVLIDQTRWPDSSFHIWHMSATDLAGRDLTKKLGWGENNQGRRWDATTKSWIYSFEWGEIRTQFTQRGDQLDVTVVIANRPGSGVIFQGATVYPLTVNRTSAESATSTPGMHWTDGINGPEILAAPVSGGQLVVSSGETKQALWLGLGRLKVAQGDRTEAVVSSCLPDGVRDTGGGLKRTAVSPGQTMTTKMTVRFVPAGTDAFRAAPEALAGFRSRWPQRLHFSDRRLIGTVYLASAGSGDKSHRSGTSSNPRRFLAGADVDMRNPGGLERFQAGILGTAANVVQNLHRMGGQGAITWDIEGQEYPPDTSYVCSPDQIARVAPEMETIVTPQSSARYAGMKLDDAYFRMIRDAGFRVGVCVRPQRFLLKADGSAGQMTLPDAEAVQELIRKMRYAHDRWGATLFYMDSTVRADHSPFTSEMLEAAAAAMPGSLLIPEESTFRSFRTTAPFASFLFHGDLGTSSEVRALYPEAFSVNLVNDVDPVQLLLHHKDLVNEVRGGDILMIHADYWQTNDAAVTQIYQEAHRQH